LAAAHIQTYTSDDGLALNFTKYDGAAGVPVLCLHGLSRNSRDFRDLSPHLATSRQVICPDFRGRGLSQWDSNTANYQPQIYVQDIVSLLRHTNTRRVIVVGTSLGGIVAAGLFQKSPEIIAGIVLNDIGPVIDPKGLERITSSIGRDPHWADWNAAAAALKAKDAVVYPDFTDDQWLDYAEKTCRINDQGVVVKDYDPAIAKAFEGSVTDLDLWPLFQCLEPLPLLLLRGELSDLLSAETANTMAAKLPNLELITIAGCGHVPTLSEPEALYAIDRFIAAIGNGLG